MCGNNQHTTYQNPTCWVRRRRTAVRSTLHRTARTKSALKKNGNEANLGFEQTLWQAADKLRNNTEQTINADRFE